MLSQCSQLWFVLGGGSIEDDIQDNTFYHCEVLEKKERTPIEDPDIEMNGGRNALSLLMFRSLELQTVAGKQ